MKLLGKDLLLAVIIALTTLPLVSGFAQGPVFTFDEFGNFTIDGVAQPSGTRAMDPTSGLTTLCYRLPFQVTAGDVVILEDVPTFDVLSDLIRFSPDGNLYFFSSMTDPAELGNLADGSMPAEFVNPFVAIESNSGGMMGFFNYKPALGSGFGGESSAGITYNFISEVPEPGTVTLAGSGALLLLVCARRRLKLRLGKGSNLNI